VEWRSQDMARHVPLLATKTVLSEQNSAAVLLPRRKIETIAKGSLDPLEAPSTLKHTNISHQHINTSSYLSHQHSNTSCHLLTELSPFEHTSNFSFTDASVVLKLMFSHCVVMS
jgi:hypothetical protein